MSQTSSHASFPQGALFGAGALIGFALLAAVYGRMTGDNVRMPPARVTAERILRFEDRTDGGVMVLDASNNHRVAIIEPGTNGFLRATVRGLAQERLRENANPTTPFRLTAWSDGRLTLVDPTIGRHIDLEAFGTTNGEAFARLLTDREVGQ
jgi:putative photosynthetic complex assembly protein